MAEGPEYINVTIEPMVPDDGLDTFSRQYTKWLVAVALNLAAILNYVFSF